MEKIIVVGGGLSGSLMAIYLAKRGYHVDIYERRPDMRKNKISAGRSINLALSVRGINALKKVGLDKDILSDGIPMYGRTMHSVDGSLNFQPYGKEGQAIYSVSRGRLNIRLLELADEFPNITLYFNHKCIDIIPEEGRCIFINENGETVTATADRIIGSDGAYAASRLRMQQHDRFDYSQSYLGHGYKELAIPAGEQQKFLMEKNALHIWPRGGFMMIALPNPNGDFTCTFFYPWEGKESFATLNTEAQVHDFFKKVFPDATTMMPTLIEDFFQNPTGSLATIRCYPWVRADKVALIGDAAHAVVPFYGQGMNCSFEDCVVLDECIEKYAPNWEQIFDNYQRLRKVNADAIADLALQNFIEMRDLVGQPSFLKKKKIEHALTELYPESFQSQYELVTFSNTPYSDALQQGAINDQILEEIMASDIDPKDAKKVHEIISNKNKEVNSDLAYNYINIVKRKLEQEKA